MGIFMQHFSQKENMFFHCPANGGDAVARPYAALGPGRRAVAEKGKGAAHEAKSHPGPETGGVPAMTGFANVKACLFDAYGTLFDVHSLVGRVAESLGDKAQTVSSAWRDKQLQYTWLRSLMRAHADFWQVTGAALDYALGLNGIDDAAIHHELMQAYLTLDAYADVAPALDELKRRGFKTAILSNGSPHMLSSAVASAGIGDALDAVLSVEDVGVYKPDPRVYRMAADRFAVEPHQLCFVSANGWDAAGAAHFGLRVAWLNRFGQKPERLPGKPGAVFKGLDALPPLLAA